MGWNDKQNLTALQNVTARHIPRASSYLENRFTFENQIWYTNKRVTLEHIETIFKTIFSPVDLHQRNHYGGYRQNRKKVTGPKWRIILYFLLF